MSKVATKAMRIARGTALTMGVSLMLALVLGVASTALAGTGVGAAFHMGKTNTVNAVTKLVGSVAGSSLLIDNNSTDAAATALNLQVEPGKVPIKVNSSARVANLNAAFAGRADSAASADTAANAQNAQNADKLDGKDSSEFVGSTYSKFESSTGIPANDPTNQVFKTVFCDAGDFAVSGGYSLVDVGTVISGSTPSVTGDRTQGWSVQWRNDATPDTINVFVVCADVGTPHQ
jgi:hypothetical protein